MESDAMKTAVMIAEKLITKIKPDTSTSMKSAVVALYTADPQGKLRYSGMIGILQIDVDRHLKSKFLRLYDIDSLTLVFQVEIYYGFQENYRQISDGVYLFDYFRGSVAFQFRSKEQGQVMKLKICSSCPSIEQYESIKKRNQETLKKQEEGKTLLGRFKNFFSDKKESEDEKHESQVLSVKKNTSISFNLQNGTFSSSNVPPEWQQVFDALKLTKEDLANKQVMGIIIEETVLKQAKRQAEEQLNKDLQQKIQMAQKEIKQEQTDFQDDISRNTMLNLPPPPPPPPPPLLAPPNARVSMLSARSNLMDQIRNNNLKLKHVEVNNSSGTESVSLDISDMNREQRNEHIQNLRKKLMMRKKALNRREAEDDDY